ncbi:MAG: creatininase family protein [Planctomycetes bacterium]|nr:creatininase family protein [Planctomycetota bacterium]
MKADIRPFGERAWPDLKRARDRGRGPERVCLLPVGAIEQHGPHLPVDTDARIADALCRAAAARTGCLSLPVLAYGCSFGHGEAWPGTLSLDPATLTRTVREIGRWLLATGFDRLLIVNSHFGNWAALKCGIDHLRLEHAAAIHVGAVNSWEITRGVKEWFLSDGDDIHANRAETSLIMHLAPELVPRRRVKDADDPDRTDGLVFTWLVPQTSRNGVTGRPSLASPEEGRTRFDEMADALALRVRRAAVEEAPIRWRRRRGAVLPVIQGD